LGIPSKSIIILLHVVHNCPGNRTAAIPRHVSFAQITCFVVAMVIFQQFVISEPDEVHHQSRTAIQQLCQHRLQHASSYSRHIMTSALHHD